MEDFDPDFEAVFNFAELVGDQLLPPVIASTEVRLIDEENPVEPFRPVTIEQATPEDLLPWALYACRREMRVALLERPARVRQRGKCVDRRRLAEAASGLRHDVRFLCQFRKNVRYFFAVMCGFAVGKMPSHVKSAADRAWAAAPSAITDRWCALRLIMGRDWKPELQESLRADVSRRASVSGYAFLLTYFTDLHQEVNEYPEWIACWVTSAQLRDQLGKLRQVDDAFEDFWRFISSLRKKGRPFEWIGCCFEVCMESRVRGRIHAHAYVSVDPLRMSGSNEMCPVEISTAELRWRNVAPHVVPLGLRSKARPNFNAAATGYYYVTAQKDTQIRVRGNQRLWQDPLPGWGWMFGGSRCGCMFSFVCAVSGMSGHWFMRLPPVCLCPGACRARKCTRPLTRSCRSTGSGK